MSVEYRVQIFAASGATFAIGALLAEFENLKNVGWAEYINDVPEAFFTLNQDDPKLDAVNDGQFKTAHVKLYRNDVQVFGGWVGEIDANEIDVVFYCYGYLAGTFWLQSDWGTTYTSQQLDTIVSAQWARAKTDLSSSRLAWVTTGTVEAPVTTTGGATPITLATYKTFYKRVLFTLKELAAIAISDTENTVVFEITPEGTFNFWKNRGQDRPNVVWEYQGNVRGFTGSNPIMMRRNDILAVGSSPNDVTLRTEASDATDISTYGRMAEPIYLSWVRDTTELARVAALRLTRAKQDDTDVTLKFHPDTIVPLHAQSDWILGDRARVKINRGLTQIDADRLIVGCQVLSLRGSEYVRAIVQEWVGA